MRYLVAVAAALGAILVFLLATASANTALFAHYYPLLLAMNAAAAVVLFGVVVYELRKLWREVRARVFGSRLTYRLLLMFALMAVLPGALVYGVSMQFAVKSIDSWFDVRVDAALDGGLELGRNALDYLQTDLSAKGRAMALDLGYASESSLPRMLDRLREQAGIANATVFSLSGRILANSSADRILLPNMPPPGLLRQGRQSQGYRAVEGEAATGLLVRVLFPVSGGMSLAAEDRVLQLVQPVPAAIAKSAESVQSVYRDYQELSLARQGIKRIYTLTLTLTLLLALLAAMAAAFVLSRRLSAPLSILAEGTRAVAQGDFSPRQALAGSDELGTLTQSFSKMTRQLEDARGVAEKSRAETETARAFLESVLANLSAGVLAFDGSFHLRACNLGAKSVLKDSLEDLRDCPLEEWPRFAPLVEAIVGGFQDGSAEWHQELELQGALPQVLLVRGSRLPGPGGGYVVVFDDITQLIAAQRSAAWGEVARRLAHEIKNPLTPIQLSAERLEHKLAEKLDNADRAMLVRSTATIVSQVEAMRDMVNAFRDYARLPAPQLSPLSLNQVVRDVLGLYEAAQAHITLDLAAELPPVAGDAGQLRQLIHNLLQNAEDALAGTEQPRISLSSRAEGGRALLVVADNGTGFPREILGRAFEPYVTTKAKGTGLGLAIVKKIVDEHHGHISLDNREPRGAEVRVDLPLATSGER
ncbi:MAG: ATP-binding protein [Rhodocyclaceae bacterium]|nr:ATP-binding protein [Rhodocyclaceae bacterium]